LLPEDQFRLVAVSARYPHGLAGLSPEQILAGLSPEMKEALHKRLQGDEPLPPGSAEPGRSG
jgi:hypothetical protein